MVGAVLAGLNVRLKPRVASGAVRWTARLGPWTSRRRPRAWVLAIGEPEPGREQSLFALSDQNRAGKAQLRETVEVCFDIRHVIHEIGRSRRCGEQKPEEQEKDQVAHGVPPEGK